MAQQSGFHRGQVDTVVRQTGQYLWCHPQKTKEGHPQITASGLSGTNLLKLF